MRNRIDRTQLHEGMPVSSGEGENLGRIERLDADAITVNGQRYQLTSIERIENDRVHLVPVVGATADAAGRRTGGATARGAGEVIAAEGEVRVPVREERLEVETRPTQRGEVTVRTEVVAEQRTVPVELTREEVHVEQRDVADRPATENDLAGAFTEGTIRVPVRGEEAVARKETVVTGEVVIDKTRTTETQQVADTVRREVVQVEVDEDYERHRTDYERAYAGRQATGGLTYDQAEPHFRTGYEAGTAARQAGRSWEESEADLRARYRAAGADDDGWERIKREVRTGFDRARGR